MKNRTMAAAQVLSMEPLRPGLKARIPGEALELLQDCPGFRVLGSTADLVKLSLGGSDSGRYAVTYELPDGQTVVEAVVHRVRNGIAVNYTEPYMRRRDPDCMVIADELPSDKPRFKDRFGFGFDEMRELTFKWLSKQKLAVFFFYAGRSELGMEVMVVAPENAAFFALGLAMLQGIVGLESITDEFTVKAVIYVAPPFRHSHFGGRQVVVHNRRPGLYEMFSYNLYPGPSAKKGVYGMLLDRGEQEKWITIHSSVVQVVTPYDNKIVFAHEGASGGGKSEMLEHIHREWDGRLRLGTNVLSGEDRYLTLPRGCELRPVADDMALCHPTLQKTNGKITVIDAEKAWFVRLNHITRYGVDPVLEECTIHSSKPVLFLNIDAAPDSTALIWEHTEDEPGKPCPNPRIVLPREIVPNILHGPVSVDVRSFGVRTPPCSRERPSYGILGLFHILPPALAWLWRLVAPRGHDNPSVIDSEGMSSEGVGSYWPFAAGERVHHANMLLEQVLDAPKTRYILCPNQHIGVWQVGFMPQWIAREYLSRRGQAKSHSDQITPSRCPLLGYSLATIMVEGQTIGSWFLRVETQPEVGEEAFDKGARILEQFFSRELAAYQTPKLSALGRQIIDCCLSGASVEEYSSFFNTEPLIEED